MSARTKAEAMADPADPQAPTNARLAYLEEWIRDCQRYNRNVDAQYVAAMADAADQRSLVIAKNAKITALEAQIRALSSGETNQ